MLILTLPRARGAFDDATASWAIREEKTVHLEHSLLAMAKWEASTKDCFISSELDASRFALYVQCMAEEEISYDEAYELLMLYGSEIKDYIYEQRVARKYKKASKPVNQNGAKRAPTFQPTEEIYAIMFQSGIPMQCETWHYSRLASLISYINKKNKGKGSKKSGAQMSPGGFNRMMNLNNSRLNGGG